MFAYRDHIMSLIDLIDTQWNVNINDPMSLVYVDGDLIDTQWNVNSSIDVDYMEWCLGFNRYIVECK